jgi:TPR repeat protein
MLQKFTVLCALAVVFNISHACAQSALVTDCDRLAAGPDDPQRKTSGVSEIVPNQAVPACESALRQYPNETRLAYQLARAYYARSKTYRLINDAAKGLQDAVVMFTKAANQGYAPAQASLGEMYETGRGVRKDNAQAIAWYRRAAEQGNVVAQIALGAMYATGRGVSKDDTQAIAWYGKAAKQGNDDATAKLAELNRKSTEESVELARKAAEQAAELARKAAEQAAELSAPKRDPNDVVGQVLNYSTFGKDEGIIVNIGTAEYSTYWYPDKSDKCLYRLHNRFPQEDKDKKLMLGQMSANDVMRWGVRAVSDQKVIDLNSLDPRNIQFQTQNDVTIIRHDTDVLFTTLGQLNIERLQRGWGLIYSNYCSGKKKAF